MTAVPHLTTRDSLHDAYTDLLKTGTLWHGGMEESLHLVVNSCAKALHVNRVSTWQFSPDHKRLYCQVLCNTHSCVIEPTLEVFAKDHALYFQEVINNRIIAAHNACLDPITQSFSKSYLKPLSITSTLDAALRKAGETTGVLCIEHTGPPRVWTDDEQNYVTSIADLLSQLMAAHALNQSEERYRQVFDGTANAVLIMHNNQMVDCNQAALDLFGCSLEEFSRHSPKRFWSDTQADGRTNETALQFANEAILNKNSQVAEWRYRRFNGTEFDGEVCTSSIDLDGSPHLVVCIQDITSRKLAHDKIQHLLSLQQAIFDGASYSIIATDLNGTIISFNQAAEKMLGYSAKEVIGHQTPIIFHDMDEINWRAIELTDELGTTIEPSFEVFTAYAQLNKTEEREWTYIHKNGARLAVQISITALRHKGQEIIGYLGIAADISERNKATEQLLSSKREMEHRANHDELTGLPNRSKLHKMTKAAIASADAKGQLLALMLLDLDRFKEVNDTLGHAIGDHLLKEIGSRLNHVLQPSRAHLYRLGGDEFAILIPNALDISHVLSLANHIHSCLRQSLKVEDITLELGGSLGISMYPEHGDNSHSLLRFADVAMYRAKTESARTIVYDSNQDSHSPRRLAMMAELGTAIREDQLLLHYQPRVEIGGKRKCLGCEALVRWQHPELGMVPPNDFIPLAEMSDLIQPLGLWVIESAFSQIKIWYEAKLDLVVSLNLSAHNLMDSTFPSHIERLLKKYDIPPHLVEIEITESTLIADPEKALRVVNRIHRLGIAFAIDDFGTGYSSLSYLKRLPVNTLKIDRSFISEMLTDEQDEVIVRSTLGLAHSFGLEAVAEGVEDIETLNALEKLNCQQVQGYLISRPVPPDVFEQWLDNYNKTNRI